MNLRDLIQSYRLRLPLLRICNALGYPRASFHREMAGAVKKVSARRKRSSHRKLSEAEEAAVLKMLNLPRFCDMAPAEIYATQLDEGRYYCSVRTMYRLLNKHRQCVQRRQRDPLKYARPELLATKPNELWSWDITKMKGPAKWTEKRHRFTLPRLTSICPFGNYIF